MRDRVLGALRIIVAAALFTAAVVHYDRLTTIDVRAVAAAAGSLAAASAAVLIVYFIKSVLFVVPAALIYVSVGLAFDTRTALLLNLAGICLEVTATFFLGRFLGGEYVKKRMEGKEWSKKLLNIKNRGKYSFLFGVRLLPAFPVDFISLFLGSSGMAFLPYFFLSVLGIMPRVVLFTLLGDSLYKYIPMRFLTAVAIAAIPAALIAWYVVRYVRKRKNTGEQ